MTWADEHLKRDRLRDERAAVLGTLDAVIAAAAQAEQAARDRGDWPSTSSAIEIQTFLIRLQTELIKLPLPDVPPLPAPANEFPPVPPEQDAVDDALDDALGPGTASVGTGTGGTGTGSSSGAGGSSGGSGGGTEGSGGGRDLDDDDEDPAQDEGGSEGDGSSGTARPRDDDGGIDRNTGRPRWRPEPDTVRQIAEALGLLGGAPALPGRPGDPHPEADEPVTEVSGKGPPQRPDDGVTDPHPEGDDRGPGTIEGEPPPVVAPGAGFTDPSPLDRLTAVELDRWAADLARQQVELASLRASVVRFRDARAGKG